MIKRIISWIPNAITCCNLLSGCVAVIMSFHIGQTFGCLTAAQWAYICIGAAALFDFCDGAAARLLRAYSEIGKELDSLSDLVSFGLAPAMLVMNSMLAGDSGVLSYGALLLAPMGALRLAKFNVDSRQATSFLGLPIPACAIFWVGTVAWWNSFGYWGTAPALILVAATGLLMVSELPMFSLKFKNFGLRENALRYAILVCCAVLWIIFGVGGLMWTILLYILMSCLTRGRTA